MMDHDLFGLGVNLVYDPIVAHPKAIKPFSSRQLDRLPGKRIGFQHFNALHHPTNECFRQRSQVFLDRGLEVTL